MQSVKSVSQKYGFDKIRSLAGDQGDHCDLETKPSKRNKMMLKFQDGRGIMSCTRKMTTARYRGWSEQHVMYMKKDHSEVLGNRGIINVR